MKKIFIIGVASVLLYNIFLGQEFSKHKVLTNKSSIIKDSIQYIPEVITSPQKATNTIQNLENETTICSNPKLDNQWIQLQENLKLAKSKKGKDYFNDGRLKLSVNIDMIESYYRFCESTDTLICWIDLLKSWQQESIRDLCISYINFDVKKNSLSEVNEYLAKKYKEREDSIRIQHSNENFITNVEFEDQ